MKRFWGYGCLGLAALGFFYFIFVVLMGPAKTNNHELSCLSRRKNQSVALVMYIQDYDERFPSNPNRWMDQLFPYLKSEPGLQCPSLKQGEYGTAFDSRLAGKSSAALADPEKTSAIFESQNRARNAASPGTGFSTRHNGFGNVGFADGHAKALNREVFEALPAPRGKELGGVGAKKATEETKK